MIILDGIPIKDFGLIPLENHSNPVSAPLSHKIKKISGRVGAHITGAEIAPKYLKFDFALKEKDASLAQIKMNEFATFLLDDLGRPRDVELIHEYEIDKYYTVRLDSAIDPQRIRGFGRFSVVFMASDPRKYAVSPSILELDGAGFNNGNCPATGKIEIEMTSDADSLDINLIGTGESIFIEHAFISGDSITIDLEKEMIYKNSYSIMQDVFLESDFFKIPVGEFEISVSSGNATLEFTERWL